MTINRTNQRTGKALDATDLMKAVHRQYFSADQYISVPDWCHEVEGFTARFERWLDFSTVCGAQDEGDGEKRYCTADAGHSGDCFGIDIANTTTQEAMGI